MEVLIVLVYGSNQHKPASLITMLEHCSHHYQDALLVVK